MKRCQNCGFEFKDDIVFFPYCGAKIDLITETQTLITKQKPSAKTFAKLTLIFGLLGALPALVFFVIGTSNKFVRTKDDNMALLVGIIFYFIWLIIFTIILITKWPFLYNLF